MKNILIIYPHWPPSNLAGVHRPRLIANFLPDLGWHPVVVTIHERHYEETPDGEMEQTVSPRIEIFKVSAFNVLRLGKKRFIGDISLRGFIQMYRKSKEIIQNLHISFIWIPIPSFYTALIGRILHETTGIPYGIDYIDPWISQLAPYHKRFSKAWWSKKIAGFLEPIAVKKAALISGVAKSYYQDVLQRNFKDRLITHIGMPYGFDPNDHDIRLNNISTPWENIPGVRPLVYAGAFLPQSHLFIRLLFTAIRQLFDNNEWPAEINLYFLGTGSYHGKKIIDYAAEAGIEHLVTEINTRFPYLHILHFLGESFGVMIIGSTERHYTASKTFQALLSKRPVFGVLHQESAATGVLKATQADQFFVFYREDISEEKLYRQIADRLRLFLSEHNKWAPDLTAMQHYSAKASAEKLIAGIETALAV